MPMTEITPAGQSISLPALFDLMARLEATPAVVAPFPALKAVLGWAGDHALLWPRGEVLALNVDSMVLSTLSGAHEHHDAIGEIAEGPAPRIHLSVPPEPEAPPLEDGLVVAAAATEPEGQEIETPVAEAGSPSAAATGPAAEGGAGEVVAATASPDDHKRGKLTEEDKAAILELAANGVRSNMQIADALGLRAQSVALFLYRQKSCPRASSQKVPDAKASAGAGQQVAAAVEVDPATAEPVASRPAPADPKPRPGWWHQITAELNSLGYRAPWTAEMDCLLVEGLLSGVRKEILADTLGVDSGQIKQRFVALTPSGTAIDYQRHVLEVLRERATVQGKAGRP